MAKFIVLEGIEGVGKTTNMEFICQYLVNKNINLVRTREPGGTPLAEKMRDIVLHSEGAEQLCADAEILLMFAARAQHLAQVIKPALAQGRWIICDRFTDASYAYQGGGRQIANKRIGDLEQWVQGDLRPDTVILLDAPAELAMARTAQRKSQDRIEQESIAFFTRVRDAYLARAAQDSQKYHVVDATQSLVKVQQALENILARLLEH